MCVLLVRVRTTGGVSCVDRAAGREVRQSEGYACAGADAAVANDAEADSA